MKRREIALRLPMTPTDPARSGIGRPLPEVDPPMSASAVTRCNHEAPEERPPDGGPERLSVADRYRYVAALPRRSRIVAARQAAGSDPPPAHPE
jgi:hypothetical protein